MSAARANNARAASIGGFSKRSANKHISSNDESSPLGLNGYSGILALRLVDANQLIEWEASSSPETNEIDRRAIQ